MQQTAAIAEPAAVKAEAAPETVPQAPRGRRPHHQYEDRKHRTSTASAHHGRRPPCRAGAPDGKRPGTCTSGSGRNRTGTPRGEGRAQAPRPQAQGTSTSTSTGRGSRTRRRNTPGCPSCPGYPGYPGSSRCAILRRRGDHQGRFRRGRSRAKACWRSCPTDTGSCVRPTTTT